MYVRASFLHAVLRLGQIAEACIVHVNKLYGAFGQLELQPW